MKTLALANQKGGVGKSALATQLAFYSAKLGYRILFIDLDHQCNSSKALLSSGLASEAGFTSGEFLNGSDQIIPNGTFVVIGGDERLKDADMEGGSRSDFANHVDRFLAGQQERFDLCILDTNPNPDIRYGTALLVADFALSPVQLNQEALDGIAALFKDPKYGLNRIPRLNPKLKFLGILPNMVEATVFQRNNYLELQGQLNQYLLPTGDPARPFAFIPKRSAIAEAQALAKPVIALGKSAARDAWADMTHAFDAILKRMDMRVE